MAFHFERAVANLHNKSIKVAPQIFNVHKFAAASNHTTQPVAKTLLARTNYALNLKLKQFICKLALKLKVNNKAMQIMLGLEIVRLPMNPKKKQKKGGIHHLVMQCNSSRGSQIRKKTLGRVQIRLLVLFYLMYPPT